MRKYYILFWFLLSIFFLQCDSSSDASLEGVKPEPTVQVKAIGMDNDFIQYVTTAKQLALLLHFNRSKRYLEKNSKRPYGKIKESQDRIGNYLRDGLTKQELPLLFKEYGSSKEDITTLVGRMSLHILLLNHKYGDKPVLEKLTSEEFNQAYDLAISQESSQVGTNGGFYCVQCPGANCESCGPGQNPDDGGGWGGTGGGDSGSGGGTDCAQVRRLAAKKRDAVIDNAWREFAAESIACAGAAYRTAVSLYGATWYLNALGPEAPFVISALGAVGVGASCMWLATSRVDSLIIGAQSDYQLDLISNGC